ncbi:MAG: heme biosynthesis HemY N-terminal domain-containing protein [Alphaproteobacteria bacterium]|nr:heme biosynthesis HemY N-terminal domain-containing protein [Alphaproteobacteria bacterium]
MVRVLAYLALVAALSAAGAWIADRPGSVTLIWQGWRLDSSVAVFAAMLAVAALLLASLILLYRWLIVSPRQFRKSREERRRRRGWRALTRGLVAAAGGDSPGARRAAEEAEALLGEPPVTLLLTAQAAQLDGDQNAAATAFRRMLEHEETEFLGLRGLLVQAVRKGDRETALALARRAFEINPAAAWVLDNLVELEVAEGNWHGAERALDKAVRARRLSRAEGKRKKALFAHQRARIAAGEGRLKEALSEAGAALDKAPDFVPAAVLAIGLMKDSGRMRDARRLAEKTWALSPHPDLAEAYAKLVDDEPLAKVKALETLVAARDDSPAGHLALAEAALGAELWGPARAHLGRVIESLPSATALRLMALVEEGENGPGDASRDWWRRASAAPADATWTCNRCHAHHGEWSLQCPVCGAVDSLTWETPGQARPAPASAPLLPGA